MVSNFSLEKLDEEVYSSVKDHADNELISPWADNIVLSIFNIGKICTLEPEIEVERSYNNFNFLRFFI
jgi:hypothetical protein